MEFALIAPVLILLYFGAVQYLQQIMANRLVTLTAGTVANIVSRYTAISASTQMPDILNASTRIMAPYSSANTTVVVSCIAIDNTGHATVAWSQALGGSARASGTSITVPPALAVPNTTLVFAEATYAFTPVFDLMHTGTSNIYAHIFMVSRASTTINLAP